MIMNEELREKLISDLKNQTEKANKLMEEMNVSDLAEKLLPIEESLKLVESP